MQYKGGFKMREKLDKFLSVLEEYGEYFFSWGNTKKDCEYVTTILKTQGFFSGTNYRFYFDNDLNLIKVEERF